MENDGEGDGLISGQGAVASSTEQPLRLPCGCPGAKHRLVLQQPRLFAQKCAMVIGASIALIPLLLIQSSLPGALYASLLVVIHVAVLVVYLWRVSYFSLDPNRTALAMRTLGLGFSIWLLSVAGGSAGKSLPVGAAFRLLAVFLRLPLLAGNTL
jgi:hypothetical protein